MFAPPISSVKTDSKDEPSPDLASRRGFAKLGHRADWGENQAKGKTALSQGRQSSLPDSDGSRIQVIVREDSLKVNRKTTECKFPQSLLLLRIVMPRHASTTFVPLTALIVVAANDSTHFLWFCRAAQAVVQTHELSSIQYASAGSTAT